MHISLDQALGRQPRLNRVGQSLLNIGSGASAAYSLRSLTGGDPKVVNVRRESDNAEQEFTASGVASGALVDFVNADGTQFMAFDGTDDDITTPALLPSTADFTLTVVAFINANPSSTEGIFGSAAAGSGRHNLQLNTDGTVQFFCENLGGAIATANTIVEQSINTIQLSRSGQTFSITLNSGTAVNQTGSSVVLTTGSNQIGDTYPGGTSNFEGVITSLSVGSTTWDGTAADATSQGWTVNGSPSTNALNDGFVETWFDQSGDGNDATDATSATLADQPKIVSSGSLVVDGNGNATLDFDGTDDQLKVASFAGGALAQPNSLFVVAQSNQTDDNQKIVSGATTTFVGTGSSLTGRYQIRAGGTIQTGTTQVDTDQHLFSVFYNTTDELFIDGSGTADISADAGSGSLSSLFIGVQDNGFNEFDGTISEVVLYGSDKKSDRTPIEDNIKNHYSIS